MGKFKNIEKVNNKILFDIANFNRNSKNYTEAREELVREMTELTTWIGRIEAKGQAMEKLMYETASHSELRAMEEIVRSNQNDIQQFKYDMKDLERQLSGGY